MNTESMQIQNRRFACHILILIFALCISSLFLGCAKKEKIFYKTAKDRISEGKSRVSQNKIKEAVNEFRVALTLEPKNFEANYELGGAYYKLKDFKKAEESLKTALTINPKDAKAHNMLGLAYEREGLFENAKASFQQALYLDKKFEEAEQNLSEMEDAKMEYNLYRFALDFIYRLSKEYSNGNNSFLRGVGDTKAVKNEFGSIIKYEISSEIYLAREYFDKCSKILEDIVDGLGEKAFSDIIDTFSIAIQQRLEAIDLQIQGYAALADYAFEFQKAKAKVEIADTYYVDSLKKVEAMMSDHPALFDEKDSAGIKDLIDYYSKKEKMGEIGALK